jgi:hypothetical protein
VQKSSAASPFQIAPSNADIQRFRISQSKGSDVSIREFTQKNIGDLKEFKQSKIEKSKLVIETVHAKLRNERQINQDLLNL